MKTTKKNYSAACADCGSHFIEMTEYKMVKEWACHHSRVCAGPVRVIIMEIIKDVIVWSKGEMAAEIGELDNYDIGLDEPDKKKAN